MYTPLRLSLAASLSIAGIGAAGASSDPCVWRWYVSNAMRAQQDDSAAPALREGRAGAIDRSISFTQRNERYFTDGSLAPAGDAALR